MNNLEDSDSCSDGDWEDTVKLYNALSKADIIYVTNYTKRKCDILFELQEGDENIVPRLFESLDNNNSIPNLGNKITYELLSKRQIEIKNLDRGVYVRKFLCRIYMIGIRKFIANKNPKIRRLSDYIIDKDKK
jgi:hypothetical protein